MTGRRQRGAVACLSGQMAEEAVARAYEAEGCRVLARRWRGQGGEIDLVCEEGNVLVFVEVKAGPTHDIAAERLGAGQIARICRAAEEFCAACAGGPDRDMRLDAALVDAQGRVRILKAAFTG